MFFNMDHLAPLIRGKQPTKKVWIELLETRRMLIKPYLNQFTLVTLGELKCLSRSGDYLLTLRDEKPEVKGLPLETQGIFDSPYSTRRPLHPEDSYCRNCTKLIWGLTRKDQWVFGSVEFEWKPGPSHECARCVTVNYSNINTILQKTQLPPLDILRFLGRVVKEWENHRRLLHEGALELLRAIEIEEKIFSLLPKK